jgi:3-hydroxymyristoyl/3-hydroxydecanoyl-(acyl carrier protein) dehydratase
MNRHKVAVRIAADHPSLPGHFPGFPIVPGVVLLDETLHAIELLQGAEEASWHITTVKFHHTVVPGDDLQLSFESQPDARLHFELRSPVALVASGTLKRRVRIRAVMSGR